MIIRFYGTYFCLPYLVELILIKELFLIVIQSNGIASNLLLYYNTILQYVILVGRILSNRNRL